MSAVTTAVLLLIGVLAAGLCLVLALALRPVRRAQSSPLTSLEVFRSWTAATIADAPRHPKLSPNGRVAALFACAYGLVGLGVSWATLHRLIEDYHTHQLPAPAMVAVVLVLPALIDGAAGYLLLKLRRHYRLAQQGRLTLGVVVAYGISGPPGLGRLIPTIYDFSPGSGVVVRGTGLLSSYSRVSPFFKTSVGAAVDVFYLPDAPGYNGLRLALLWEV